MRLRLLGLLILSDTHVATQWLYSEGVVPAKRPLFVCVLVPNDSDQSLVICNFLFAGTWSALSYFVISAVGKRNALS